MRTMSPLSFEMMRPVCRSTSSGAVHRPWLGLGLGLGLGLALGSGLGLGSGSGLAPRPHRGHPADVAIEDEVLVVIGQLDHLVADADPELHRVPAHARVEPG